MLFRDSFQAVFNQGRRDKAVTTKLSHEVALEAQETRLDVFLTKLREFLSDDQVVTETAEVSRRLAVTQHRSFPARVFVYPSSREQLTDIIKLANDVGVAVHVMSKGKNWGYGSATGTLGSCVNIVLERLNRIVRVDSALAFAVIEPGVTYRQLYEYLSKHHPDLWTDCTDSTPEGSVIGNALERGLGFTPYGDHFGSLCGLEVMLADGRTIRTGAVFDDESPTFHCHKWGTGPILEGLFSQSNFGIVIKAGIWLMPRPEYHVSVVADIRRPEDVFPTIDSIRQLQLEGTIHSKVHMANDIVNLAVFARQDVAPGSEPLPPDQVTSIRNQYGIPPWSFAFAIYGTKAQVKASRKRVAELLKPTAALNFFDDPAIGMVRTALRWSRRFPAVAQILRWFYGKTTGVIGGAESLHALTKGVPSEYLLKHGYYRNNDNCPDNNLDPARDGCGLTWFAPVIPSTGEHLRKMIALTKPLFGKYGMDFYLAVLFLNPRSCVTLFSIFYQKEDSVSRQRAEDLYEDLQRATQNAGYQQYRTSTVGAAGLYRLCPEYGEFLSRIKSAVDPDAILSPGRYGIAGRGSDS
jgi:4-cresol dehydrogenase (hydroxylating)